MMVFRDFVCKDLQEVDQNELNSSEIKKTKERETARLFAKSLRWSTGLKDRSMQVGSRGRI